MPTYYEPKSGGPRVHLAFVKLTGVEIDMEIGIEPREQGRTQRIVIDVEVGFSDVRTRIPDSREGLQDGFNYASVRSIVQNAVKPRTYLLETIANTIADTILALPGALTCDVTVSKKRCWANVETTSVRIQREA